MVSLAIAGILILPVIALVIVAVIGGKDARLYRKWLAAKHPDDEIYTCDANVRGGWDRGGGDRGSFGVWLDLPKGNKV
jgi:hypothetical protein